jgi:hypothetical protein
MKKNFLLVLITMLSYSFLITSCETEENEDVTQQVNKDGSIESAIQVKHIDSLHDELITKHIVWINNKEFKSVLYRDTIPALGKKETEAENSDGDIKKVTIDKAYEIYITIK